MPKDTAAEEVPAEAEAPVEAPAEAPAEPVDISDHGIAIAVEDLPFAGVDPNMVRIPASPSHQPFAAE